MLIFHIFFSSFVKANPGKFLQMGSQIKQNNLERGLCGWRHATLTWVGCSSVRRVEEKTLLRDGWGRGVGLAWKKRQVGPFVSSTSRALLLERNDEDDRIGKCKNADTWAERIVRFFFLSAKILRHCNFPVSEVNHEHFKFWRTGQAAVDKMPPFSAYITQGFNYGCRGFESDIEIFVSVSEQLWCGSAIFSTLQCRLSREMLGKIGKNLTTYS